MKDLRKLACAGVIFITVIGSISGCAIMKKRVTEQLAPIVDIIQAIEETEQRETETIPAKQDAESELSDETDDETYNETGNETDNETGNENSQIDDNGQDEENAPASDNEQDGARGEFMAAYHAAMQHPDGKLDNAKELDVYNSLMWKITASTYSYPGEIPSEVIDRGDCYEVTNASIIQPYVIPDDVYANFTPGYQFSVSLTDQNGNPSTQNFTVASQSDGTFISLWELAEYDISYPEYYVYWDEESQHYLINMFEDDAACTGAIYHGSLYFSKDCVVYGYGYGYGFSGGSDTQACPTVSFEEYLTVPHSMENGFEYGLHGESNGSTYLGTIVYGIPVFDPSTGLIVEYIEQYTP